MTPLIFATALALAGPIQTQPDAAAASPILRIRPTATLGSRDLMGKPLDCTRALANALGPDGLPLKKLGELPPAVEEHAVNRIVNGCPVREIVYAGQTYYLEAPVGGLEYDLHGARHY